MPRLPGQKVLLFELFTDMFLQTDGSASYVHTELDIPDLESVGWQAESMYVLTVTRNRTSNHAWAVTLSGSNTGRTWSTPVAVMTDVTGNGESSSGLYSTVGTYAWRKIKAMASCRNSTGAARESAQCSAWLVVILRS